jgi:hypothetical protein
MSKKEEVKALKKRIKEVELDRQRALFDYNYGLAAQINQALKTLHAQKKHLEENSEESENHSSPTT